VLSVYYSGESEMEEWEAREQSEQRSGSARASICCDARRESRVYQSALGYFVKRREFGLLSHYWRAWRVLLDSCVLVASHRAAKALLEDVDEGLKTREEDCRDGRERESKRQPAAGEHARRHDKQELRLVSCMSIAADACILVDSIAADACISAECSAYTADAPWQHQTQLRESQRKRVETKQTQYFQQAYTSSCGDTLTVETLTPNGSIKYTSTACNFSSVKGVVRERQEDAAVKRRNAPLACLIQADECMMVQVPFKGNSNLNTHNNPAIKPHPMTWCSGRKW
jgi:hypothetical protein